MVLIVKKISRNKCRINILQTKKIIKLLSKAMFLPFYLSIHELTGDDTFLKMCKF